MKKVLVLALALLVATPAWADYRYNPYTGKLDYYEKSEEPDLSAYLTSATAASTYAPITEPLSVHLDQTTPQVITATETTITASDELYFGDATDSSKLKKDTVQGILDLVSAPDLTPYAKLDGTNQPFTGSISAVGNLAIGGNTTIAGTFAVGTNKLVLTSKGKVGIGTTDPYSMLNIHQISRGLKGISITGYGYNSQSPTSTEGICIYMNYNDVGNRQTVIGSTDAVGSPYSGVFRFLTGGYGYAMLDAVSGDGANRFLTIMGTDTTNVGVGYSNSIGTGEDYTGRLSVFTSNGSGSRTNLLIKKFGTASGDYIDVKNSSDTSLLKLDSTGKLWIADKVVFTQTDGNEYIDSLADGYMDYGATTAHRFLANVKLTADNRKIIFGTGDDASIYYDGTNAIINPKEVGSGYLNIKGITLVDDKIMFTQTDGNEYIDSLADGYMDYGATTQHRFNNDVDVDGDITADSISAVHKAADGTAAVADGTYTVGIGTTTNGTITIKDGIITAIQEAT